MPTNGYPSREEADALLTWAHMQNPGPWAGHSRAVARIAETVARQCKMDADRGYVTGLLHDIGRYEGSTVLHHVIAGYELLHTKGYGDAARICLTHSFPYPDLRAYCGTNDCTSSETDFLLAYLESTEMDDYDRLIQLADALGWESGAVLIDIRLLDVIRRHGCPELGREKIDATFAIKADFDRIAGMDIYGLFADEILANCFR